MEHPWRALESDRDGQVRGTVLYRLNKAKGCHATSARTHNRGFTRTTTTTLVASLHTSSTTASTSSREVVVAVLRSPNSNTECHQRQPARTPGLNDQTRRADPGTLGSSEQGLQGPTADAHVHKTDPGPKPGDLAKAQAVELPCRCPLGPGLAMTPPVWRPPEPPAPRSILRTVLVPSPMEPSQQGTYVR